MDIKIDNLESGDVIQLLQEHMQDMLATSPAESVHALDVPALKAPSITFFSARECGQLLGCVAIKELSTTNAEIKSMRTHSHARNSGVASTLLEHVLVVAKKRGYESLSLETGSMAFFKPARKLYIKYGFTPCEPFSNYQSDPNNTFMSIDL
ncbi:GNAT family N-acetyltransferase [Vibrio sp. DW001]|uniref:GNAT family N-acetyltransferase n=1 Tax=Vibrio sp. DW001 TaxID=2912315 RepID=UPI0023AEF34E|nr:GNAT family N-acetyltransferase [Vibrio sp. DW001]WED29080.1 GNAT family N-acetyltransferase [Vibrio sp. DW001]